MKDFPMFTTEYGAASLILKEIPYRKKAYIQIQSSLDPEMLLAECVSFCKICGAEHIYAAGHDYLERFPLHTVLYRMKGIIPLQEEEVMPMFPVTEQTVAAWRAIYNEKMKAVDNASTMEARDEAQILASGGAYYIHDAGDVYGIGWLDNDTLKAVAAVKPGAGEKVCKAMQSLMPGQTLNLEVASTNTKAIRLYERLGLLMTGEINRWYTVE